MQIELSREGVFPTAGDPRDYWSESGTIQGEGKLAGVASLFVRLQGCNLRCKWCDTKHTWGRVGNTVDTGEVVETIGRNIGKMRHVVITGGEPYMQARAVEELVDRLHERGLHVTIETNGSIADRALTEKVDLLSISPKMSNSGASVEEVAATARAVRETIGQRRGDVQLKFVVSEMADGDEIAKHYDAEELGIERSDILVMPEGVTREAIGKKAVECVRVAVRHGWRYCARLHIDIFGNKEGI